MDRRALSLCKSEEGVNALRVALGRHALALIAQDLRERGIHQIAVPAYHCLTMTLPFQLEGLRIVRVPVGPDLIAEPRLLRECIADRPASWAILHCEVFGAAPSGELRAVLEAAREAGAALVVDSTHRWPLEPHIEGDELAVSTRKLLGLPDGGLAAGALMRPDGPRPSPRNAIDDKATAAWIAGDVDEAEELMDEQLVPVPMSPQARALASQIDLDALVRRRRRMTAALHDALVDQGLTPISPREGHFCVAFRHPDAKRLVIDFARRDIDGPVWWPRPSDWHGPWPEDVVTLPVDASLTAGMCLDIMSSFR